MLEQNGETLPVAPTLDEDLPRRIQIAKEISEQIVWNSYKPEGVTDEILREYTEEFDKTQRRIGRLSIEWTRHQTTVLHKEAA